MRVAIFAGDYKPVRGGTSISVQLAVKALQRRGAQVHVFTADTPELDGDPVAVPLPSCPVRLGGVRMAMVRPIPARRVAERRARELGIDVVHTFSPFLEGWIARHVATRLEAPLVWTCQTMWLHYLHYVPMWNLVRGTSAEPYLGRAALFWVRRFAEHCSGVVFPTLRTRDALLDGSPIRARVAILPQGFEVEALRSGDGAKERRELGLEEGKTLLVTVGRMVREKNVDFLLEALAPILRAKRSHLVLAGDGPKRRDYEALAVALKISSSVIFLGHVAYERIPALLAAADVFVFASLSDAQALAAWEAIAAGCPVVAVDAPGPADIVSHGVDGLLTPADPSAFRQAVLRLVEDPELRASMARHPGETCSAMSVSEHSRKLESFYRSLRDRPASPKLARSCTSARRRGGRSGPSG